MATARPWVLTSARATPACISWAFWGGSIWGVGFCFSIIAAGAAGYAISYGLGQGATMVAAFWGVFVWKEFEDSPEGTHLLIAAMFALFLLGLGLIIYSRVA